jgi:hypothetical protein
MIEQRCSYGLGELIRLIVGIVFEPVSDWSFVFWRYFHFVYVVYTLG